MRARPTMKRHGHFIRFRPGTDVNTSKWRCEACEREHVATHHFDDEPCTAPAAAKAS